MDEDGTRPADAGSAGMTVLVPPAVRPESSLRWSSRDVAGVRVVALEGEADHRDEDRLRDVLGDAAATGRPVLVDLAGLRFMSAGVLRVLVEARIACGRRGLVLAAPCGLVVRLLEATRAIDRFRVYPSRWAALDEQTRRAA